LFPQYLRIRPMTDAVALTISGPVARITLNRPHRRNALDGAAWQQLVAHTTALATRGDVRVVVVTGEGEHFSAGADIREMQNHMTDAAWMQANQAQIAAGLDAIGTLPQVVIAAVAGSCFGGGAAMALAADFRIASETARFAITPARLGLTYRLADCLRVVDIVGPARAREILLLAREVSASDALAWGMVTSVVESARLPATTDEMVAHVIALSGHSQRFIKANLVRIFRGQRADDDATRAEFAAAFAGQDFLAAADAFVNRAAKP
jgi:enoyl-CoA hydratase